MNAVNLGDKVKDLVSGFEGVVTTRSNFVAGCTRYRVDGTGLNGDGMPVDSVTFDETHLSVIQPNFIKARSPIYTAADLGAIGSLARDVVTGVEGMIVATHEQLDGTVSYSLQPRKPKPDGSIASLFHRNMVEVEIIPEKPVVQTPHPTSGRPGGPQRSDYHR